MSVIRKGAATPLFVVTPEMTLPIFLSQTIAIFVSAPTKGDMLNERPSEDFL